MSFGSGRTAWPMWWGVEMRTITAINWIEQIFTHDHFEILTESSEWKCDRCGVWVNFVTPSHTHREICRNVIASGWCKLSHGLFEITLQHSCGCAYVNQMHFQYTILISTNYVSNLIKSCVSIFPLSLSLLFFHPIYSFGSCNSMHFQTNSKWTIDWITKKYEAERNTNARVAAIKNNEKSLQFCKTSRT